VIGPLIGLYILRYFPRDGNAEADLRLSDTFTRLLLEIGCRNHPAPINYFGVPMDLGQNRRERILWGRAPSVTPVAAAAASSPGLQVKETFRLYRCTAIIEEVRHLSQDDHMHNAEAIASVCHLSPMTRYANRWLLTNGGLLYWAATMSVHWV